MFDEKTVQQLGYYVYALFDETGRAFYIGKGIGQRVFNHVACALEDGASGKKYETIQDMQSRGQSVRHVIIRHGMDEETAFQVESALIDFSEALEKSLTNAVLGHHASIQGLMTTEEIIRRYNAEPLQELRHPSVIININGTYRRAKAAQSIYEAARQWWVIAKHRRESSRYALAEYRGLIVEVFEISKWFNDGSEGGKRWAFEGKVAPDTVRDCYINKSIKHAKKKGAANPLRFSLPPYDARLGDLADK